MGRPVLDTVKGQPTALGQDVVPNHDTGLAWPALMGPGFVTQPFKSSTGGLVEIRFDPPAFRNQIGKSGRNPIEMEDADLRPGAGAGGPTVFMPRWKHPERARAERSIAAAHQRGNAPGDHRLEFPKAPNRRSDRVITVGPLAQAQITKHGMSLPR
jgi:hypothetical protein